jgi:parvulin-like peptidyl-prolyl isomerase
MPKKQVKKKTNTTKTSNTKKQVAKPSKVEKQQNHSTTYVGLLILVIAAILIVIFSNVGQDNGMEQANIAAMVNGEPIYNEELNSEYAKIESFVTPETNPDDIKAQLLARLIEQKILLIHADEAGITVSDEEVIAEITKILDSNGITLSQFEASLEGQGITMDEVKAQIQKQLILIQFLDENVFNEITVSEEEILAFYQSNPSTVPETVLARHILVSVDDSRTDEEALALITQIQETFEADNDKFCELVTTYSEDPGSLETCGEYPAFTRDSNFVQEYKDAAFANEPGTASIAKTVFGYHLVYTIEKTAERTFTLEEVRSQINTNLYVAKKDQVLQDYLQNEIDNSNIINCLETPGAEICGGNAAEEPNIPENTNNQEETDLAGFAQCITDSGAKMYGAYWCSHCNAQKELFGDAVEYIPYVECAIENQDGQNEACTNAGIQGYPTWVINNQQYTGEQTLEKLATLTGCHL